MEYENEINELIEDVFYDVNASQDGWVKFKDSVTPIFGIIIRYKINMDIEGGKSISESIDDIRGDMMYMRNNNYDIAPPYV